MRSLCYGGFLIGRIRIGNGIRAVIQKADGLGALRVRGFVRDIGVSTTARFNVALPLPRSRRCLSFVRRCRGQCWLVLLWFVVTGLEGCRPRAVRFMIPSSVQRGFPPILFRNSAGMSRLVGLIGRRFGTAFPRDRIARHLLSRFRVSRVHRRCYVGRRGRIPGHRHRLLRTVRHTGGVGDSTRSELTSVGARVGSLTTRIGGKAERCRLSDGGAVQFTLSKCFLCCS